MPRRKLHARKRKQPKAKAIAKVVKSVIKRREEPKVNSNIYYNASNVDIYSTPPNSILLTAISGGSTVSTRVGNQCWLERSHAKFLLSTALPVANTSTTVRLIVFWDRQPVIGTPVTLTALLDCSIAGLNQVMALPNVSNRRRFKIIRDKTYNFLNVSNNLTTNSGQRQVGWNIKFKKRPKLSYTDATSTNIQGPHLYFFIYSLEAANTFNITGQHRVVFREE